MSTEHLDIALRAHNGHDSQQKDASGENI